MSPRKRQRRLRGTKVVQLNLTVDPDAKAKIDVIADTLGLSEGIVFDLIMKQISIESLTRPDFVDPGAPARPDDPAQGDLLAS